MDRTCNDGMGRKSTVVRPCASIRPSIHGSFDHLLLIGRNAHRLQRRLITLRLPFDLQRVCNQRQAYIGHHGDADITIKSDTACTY